MPSVASWSPGDNSGSLPPSTALQSNRGQNDGISQDSAPSVTPAPHQKLNIEGGNARNVSDDSVLRDANQNNNEDGAQQSSQQGNDDEEWLMACRCENGKTLVALLSCLQHVAANPSDYNTSGLSMSGATSASATQSTGRSFSQKRKKRKKMQPVTIFYTPAGFTFHVCSPAKNSEASIELQKAMFSQYQVRQESPDQEDWQAGGEFCVNLSTVMDALQWLGPLDSRTSIGLSYNLASEIFKVELLLDCGPGSSGGVLCTTAIPGLMAPEDDPEGDSLSNAFRSAPVAARMMVRSGILRELLPEWSGVAGASCACIAISAKRGLEIAVLGHYGESWAQIPPTGDHMVSPLELADDNKTVTRSYAIHSLISSMKGLEISEESVISINSQGIMAIQHKTIDPTSQGSSNFVDFIMTCLEDEDEDEEGDQEEKEGGDTRSQQSPQASLRSFQNRNSQEQSQATTETAVTPPPRRTRISHDDDEEDGSRRTPHNTTGDDVEQGSSDTEGEGESPSERQKLQAQQRRKQCESPSGGDSDDDDNDDDVASSLAAPLFGTVVRSSSPGTGSGTETPPRRRQRRSMSRSQLQAKRSKGRRGEAAGGGNDSDASKNMLDGSSDDDNENDQSSDDEGHLDLAALARSPAREQQREEECSSPELVYG